MTDYSNPQPAAVKSKLIKTGLLSHPQPQRAGFKPKPSLLKQPLSSINTNYILNQNTSNNNYDRQQQINRTRASSFQRNQRIGNDSHLNDESISDDALKSNVQIVLNNIQNALLNQQKAQQDLKYQDRFQYLNIFGEHSPPSSGGVGIVNNQRNCNYQNLRKMSTSPADCDSTNNNMGPASMLGCSFASDFTHDNSDYQWFVDYG